MKKPRKVNPRKGKRPPKPYRSWFEFDVAPTLPAGTLYEATTVEYTLACDYTPDWKVPLKRGHCYIETTGKLDYEKRRKLVAVKKAHPTMDLRVLLMRDQRLGKGTYLSWLIKNGFKATVFPTLPL